MYDFLRLPSKVFVLSRSFVDVVDGCLELAMLFYIFLALTIGADTQFYRLWEHGAALSLVSHRSAG